MEKSTVALITPEESSNLIKRKRIIERCTCPALNLIADYIVHAKRTEGFDPQKRKYFSMGEIEDYECMKVTMESFGFDLLGWCPIEMRMAADPPKWIMNVLNSTPKEEAFQELNKCLITSDAMTVFGSQKALEYLVILKAAGYYRSEIVEFKLGSFSTLRFR